MTLVDSLKKSEFSLEVSTLRIELLSCSRQHEDILKSAIMAARSIAMLKSPHYKKPDGINLD
jgi:hypothetical protein